ncbi:MAG: cache domain-containing protein [Gemmatimonadota bacterium]|nr:cache domain-containing protein [Gemmatimonadota bacterium]
MKRLIAVLMLALATFLSAAHSATAQDAEITAGDVVDRETLKAFVLAAKAYGDKASTLPEYLNILQEFRTEGPWKQGSIYLFLFSTEGLFILHGADPSLEGQNLIDLEDVNGVKMVQELIAVAAEGGGYVEYLWPNPAIAGDTGSPKVSYAIPYSALGQDFVLGAGFFPESASTAVEDQSWGQLKSHF